MYSITSSLFTIFSLALIAIQSFAIKAGYTYPKVVFIILTIVSVAFAVYYFVKDCKDK